MKPEARVAFEEAVRAAEGAFNAAGWKWAGVGVPDAEAIRTTMHHLLASHRAYPQEGVGWSSATGRLVLERGEGGDVEVLLSLGTLEDVVASEGEQR